MVVALHLEHDRLAAADVDDAGVLARPLDHPGRFGRQPAQMQPRRLVRAVLVPHCRENPELGETRHPPDQLQNALVLIRLQPVAGDEFGGDLRFVSLHLLRLWRGPHIRSLPPCGGGLGRGVSRKRRSPWYPPLHLSPTRGERADRTKPIDGRPTSRNSLQRCRSISTSKSVIREIGSAGKGLLWRNFPLSIALRAPYALSGFALRSWIGFKG